jgi:hypothetical protein
LILYSLADRPAAAADRQRLTASSADMKADVNILILTRELGPAKSAKVARYTEFSDIVNCLRAALDNTGLISTSRSPANIAVPSTATTNDCSIVVVEPWTIALAPSPAAQS